jgi:hypothetical protein
MPTEPLKYFRGIITSEAGLLVDERVRSIIRLMQGLDLTEQQDVKQ